MSGAQAGGATAEGRMRARDAEHQRDDQSQCKTLQTQTM